MNRVLPSSHQGLSQPREILFAVPTVREQAIAHLAQLDPELDIAELPMPVFHAHQRMHKQPRFKGRSALRCSQGHAGGVDDVEQRNPLLGCDFREQRDLADQITTRRPAQTKPHASLACTVRPSQRDCWKNGLAPTSARSHLQGRPGRLLPRLHVRCEGMAGPVLCPHPDRVHLAEGHPPCCLARPDLSHHGPDFAVGLDGPGRHRCPPRTTTRLRFPRAPHRSNRCRAHRHRWEDPEGRETLRSTAVDGRHIRGANRRREDSPSRPTLQVHPR